MADDFVWNGGVVEASNVFYDEDLEIHAKMHCATCCSSKEGNNTTRLEYDPNTGRDKIDPSTGKGGNCWLPRLSSGKYYLRASDTGQVKAKQAFEITQDCDSPERFDYYQVCIPNKTYSSYQRARCRADCNRDSGLYDIGIDECVSKNWGGYLNSPDQEGTGGSTWQVTMNRQNYESGTNPGDSGFVVKGLATCASPTTDFTYSIGAYKASLDEGVKNGNYCFCRMTSVEFYSKRLDSRTGNMKTEAIEHGTSYKTGWVAVKDYRTNSANCGTSCDFDCAYAVRTNSTVRTKMYENYDQ